MGDKSVQGVIDVALGAFASTLGQAGAAAQYKSKTQGAFTVTTELTKLDENWISVELGIPNVAYTGGNKNRTGHPRLGACREIIRCFSDRTYDPAITQSKTLLFGCSARELSMYGNCENCILHFGDVDGKDADRTDLEILNRLRKRQKKVIGKTPAFTDQVLLNSKALIAAANTLGLKAQIVNSWVGVKCDVICFFDSCYTLHRAEYCRLFEETGATKGHGYGFFPYELTHAKVSASDYYVYREEKNRKGVLIASVTTGGELGYAHQKDTYAALVGHDPILRDISRASSPTLAVQINFQVDAMMHFTILRPKDGECITTNRAPPAYRMGMDFLDIYASFDHTLGFFKEPVYRRIPEKVAFTVLKYVQALPPAVFTSDTGLASTVAFIRKRMSGVSMSSKSLENPWALRDEYVYPLAAAVLLHHTIMSSKMMVMMKKGNDVGTRATDAILRLVDSLPGLGRFVRWIHEQRYTDKLLRFYERDEVFIGEAIQSAELWHEVVSSFDVDVSGVDEDPTAPPKAVRSEIETPEVSAIVEAPTPKDRGLNLDCPICRWICGSDTGTQVFHCSSPKPTKVKFSMTADQLAEQYRRLESCAMEPGTAAPLSAVIMKCATEYKARCMPFDKEFELIHFRGGPGCGKSHLIRALYDEAVNPAIAVPFSALINDYCGSKVTKKMRVKTLHKLWEADTAGILYIDEYPCADLDLILLFLAANPSVERIVIVGDQAQTQLREDAGEGRCILHHLVTPEGNAIKIEDVATHSLRKNYRLGKNLVAWLNRRFGYNMIANRLDDTRVKWCSPQWLNAHPEYLKDYMATTEVAIYGPHRKSVPRFLASEDVDTKDGLTIRQCQGKTFGVSAVLLSLESEVRTWTQIKAFELVGMSRATDEVLLVISPSTYMKDYVAELAAVPLATDLVETFGWTSVTTTSEIDAVEPEIIQPQVKPTCDAYAHMVEVAPLFDGGEGAEESNAVFNEMLRHHFKDGMHSTLLALTEDKTKTGAPRRGAISTTAMASGWGNHYDNKIGTEAETIAKRYYNTEKKEYALSVGARTLAEEINRNDVAIAYDPVRVAMAPFVIAILMDDISVEHKLNKLQRVSQERKYLNRLASLQHLAEELETELARFSNKPGFKPGVGFKEPNPEKAPQGIVADPTTWLLEYMWACRLIAGVRAWCLRSIEDGGNVFQTAHEVSDEQVAVNYKIGFDSTLAGATHEHTSLDTAECDSMQTAVTQHIERCELRDLGFSQHFIESYYDRHAQMQVETSVGRIRPGYVNTSGKPGTKTVNEKVCRALGLYVLTIKGKFIGLFEGDDLQITHLIGCCKIDEVKLARVNSLVCKYSLLYTQGKYGEFCGKLVVGNSILPSLLRRVNRILAAKYRSYEDFAKAQGGIRQFALEHLNADTVDDLQNGTILMLVEYFELPFPEAQSLSEAMWEFVCSMGHINQQQWAQVQQSSNNTSYIFPDLYAAPTDIDFFDAHAAHLARWLARKMTVKGPTSNGEIYIPASKYRSSEPLSRAEVPLRLAELRMAQSEADRERGKLKSGGIHRWSEGDDVPPPRYDGWSSAAPVKQRQARFFDFN